MPNGEDLRALIDALEPLFRFGNGFNGSDPEFFCAGGVKSDANALPAVFHAEHGAGKCAAETEILTTFGRFKKTVGLGGSEEVDDGLDADGDGLGKRLLQLQADLAGDFAAIRRRAECEALSEGKPGSGGSVFRGELEVVFANELSIIGGSGFDVEGAAGKTRVFLQFKSFVFGLRAGRVEKQNAEGVAGPAIVAEKTFEAGLFDESLFVDGRDRAGDGGFCGFAEPGVIRLGPALNGIDERRRSGTKIESSEGAAVRWFEQSLVFGGGEKVLVSAVGVVVEQFDARHESGTGLAVSDGLGANKTAPEFGAEMRSVESAEDAVPVSVIALRAEEQVSGLCEFIGRLRACAPRGNGSDASGDAEHFFVEQVGLGVFAEETAPGAAAQEGNDFGATRELFLYGVVTLADTRGENPLHHFGVRSGGKIGTPQGRMIGEVFARSGDAEPRRVFFESGEEILEPAVFVAMSVGAGPNAEFFHVIAHGSHAGGMNGGSFAKIFDDIDDFAERDVVTERFLAGEKPDALAAVFGDVGAEEFFWFETGGKKMNVVDESVVDSGGGQCRGELRLPDALGDPGACGATAKMVFKIGRETRDLFALILRGDGDEDGFVETAANEFYLSGGDEGFQPDKILGAIFFDPSEERARIVQAHVDAGVFFEELDEWEVGVLVGFFEHVAEIAAGLMGMNQEDEMKTIGHRDNLALKHHNVSSENSDSRDEKNARKAHLG